MDIQYTVKNRLFGWNPNHANQAKPKLNHANDKPKIWKSSLGPNIEKVYI